LRDWLSRKQKETRQGRAELRLAERAALWNSKPENRHLPSCWEWANILLWSKKKNWTPAQRKIMSRASRYHAVRSTLLVTALVLIALIAVDVFGRIVAHGLRDRLLNADINDVPAIVQDMQPYRRWEISLLQAAYAQTESKNDARKQLHLALALLPNDPGQFDYLYGRLLSAGPEDLRVIRDSLRVHQETLVKRLQNVVGDPKEDPERRLRAACALAGCEAALDEAAESCWRTASSLIADQLLTAVQRNPSHYPLLVRVCVRHETAYWPRWPRFIGRRIDPKKSEVLQRTFWPSTLPTDRMSWPTC
jgi:hypothetical protein